MAKKIIIPTDGRENSFKELEFAQKMIEENGEIVIVSVANEIIKHHFQSETDIEPLNDLFKKTAIKNAETMLSKVPKDIKVKTRIVINSSIADGIIEVAKEEKADLIIISRSNKTGINRILLGSVSEKLVKNANINILLIKN